MPFLRLLLPIVAALALLGQSVSTFAAAGLDRQASCCCPNPDTCKCHDHKKDHGGEPQMSKCGQQGEIVAPAPLAAILPEAAPVFDAVALPPIASPEPLPMPSDRTIEPMVPPF